MTPKIIPSYAEPLPEDAKLSINVTLELSQAFTYPRKGLTIEQVTTEHSKLNNTNSVFIYSSYNLIRIIEKITKNRIQAQKALHLFSRLYQHQEKADYGAYKDEGARLSSEILNWDYGARYFLTALRTLITVGAINPPSGYWENLCRRYSINKSFDFGAIECFRMAVSPEHVARLSGCAYWYQNSREKNKSPFPEWLPKSEQETYTKYKDYLGPS
jgi:hypothetical protein